MSLIQDIQNAAVDSKTPVSEILRKLKVLAYRLKNKELDDWVEQELNGYPSNGALPPYRTMRAEVRGTVVSLARQATLPIPAIAVSDADHRRELFTLSLSDGVAEYEQLLALPSDQDLQAPWPADYVALYSESFYEGFRCLSAWRVLSRGTVAGVLDTVRNKALTFALELEKEAQAAGNDEPTTQSVSAERVHNLILQTFYGGQHAIATGEHSSASSLTISVTSEIGSLMSALSELGLPSEELQALQDAMTSDRGSGYADAPGPAAKSWLGEIAFKISSKALELGSNASAGVIAGLVLEHLASQGH